MIPSRTYLFGSAKRDRMRKVLLILGCLVGSVSLVWLSQVSESHSRETDPRTRQFTLSCQLEIENLPAGLTDLDIWIPCPLSDERQQITDFRITPRLPYEMYADPVYDNQIIHFALSDQIPRRIQLNVEFDVNRTEDRSILDGERLNNVTTDLDISLFLSSNKLVPVTGRIAREADSVAGNYPTALEKTRALYWHLIETMRYDKSGEGWGNGDALYACNVRRGNCTDIHSLFIGMARSLNIPARFVIGFPLPEEPTENVINGYHCWAEFYLKDRGWLPVDISEAIKHPENREYFFGQLDANRVSFTVGRDIELRPEPKTVSLNYFVYPYVLVDGLPYTDIKYTFGVSSE